MSDNKPYQCAIGLLIYECNEVEKELRICAEGIRDCEKSIEAHRLQYERNVKSHKDLLEKRQRDLKDYTDQLADYKAAVAKLQADQPI